MLPISLDRLLEQQTRVANWFEAVRLAQTAKEQGAKFLERNLVIVEKLATSASRHHR